MGSAPRERPDVAGAARHRATPARRGTPRLNAIDVHFHAIPDAFADAVRRGDLADVLEFAEGETLRFHAPAGTAVEPGLALRPRVHDPALVLAAMDRMRLDAAAVSSPPEFFMNWAPAEAGARIARIVNDGYAGWAGAHPGRLFPLAVLPMQDPALAVIEARRALGTLGLRGVAVCTHVGGVDLDDTRFDPIWETVAAAGAPVFLHPQNAGDVSRLAKWHMWNTVGFPLETAVAATRLIMSGTLARHPGLKLILAHGGGFMPYQLGRLDHAWHVRPALREALPSPPSAYLRQIWCDNLVHDPAALRFLLERVGEDHVVLGTDHPFDMGTADPLSALASLPTGAARRVAGETLVRLLRI